LSHHYILIQPAGQDFNKKAEKQNIITGKILSDTYECILSCSPAANVISYLEVGVSFRQVFWF